jgi:L-asparaginase/Glu-tRNA(Gln) amidotransferase subunit D
VSQKIDSTAIGSDDVSDFADNFSPQKARILLQLDLTKTNKPNEMQRLFDEYDSWWTAR